MIMRSLLIRIAVIFFATTTAVVAVLMLVVNYQISEHFNWYLNMSGMHSMMMNQSDMASMMGRPETQFLKSLKQSLMVTAGIMLFIGGAVSYYLARNIARPVLDLNRAVNQVTAGDLDVAVIVNRKDEVGQLAAAFNTMTTKLKSATILRQRFLAGIAHELRTPLTILKANLEGIADGVIAPDQEQIDSLNEEVDRLIKMVGELRDLSLLEAGQMAPEFREVDISYILRQVVTKSKPLADEKKIDLQVKIVEGTHLAFVDSAMVSQIVYNLVLNAIKYTDAGGFVTVEAKPKNEMIEIGVTDSGVGIAMEDREHVFDYFYRVDPARTKQSGGTGLGLALVKQMTLAHGGEVKVKSAVGQGSTFTVLLPKNLHKKRIVSP
jgi:signal transduction histidine kinase